MTVIASNNAVSGYVKANWLVFKRMESISLYARCKVCLRSWNEPPPFNSSRMPQTDFEFGGRKEYRAEFKDFNY